VTDPADGPAPARTTPIGRRVVLGSLGLGGLGVLFGSQAQRQLSKAILPITLRDPTGLTDLLPVAGRFRIYSVTDTMPRRSVADYRLRVDGLVERPTELSYDDVHQRLPQVSIRRDFQCVTGWRVDDVPWVGVPLHHVLDEVGVLPSATRVHFHSFDGTYTESLSLEQARHDDVLVAHSLEGKALTREHGGPVRLYVAPMYGYKSLKWLDRIELVDHLVEQGGYWEQRGYDLDGFVGASNNGHEAPIEQ
jgi:DMSO/TMAO reductase YedYZ molybdopterin-dependent catalytic subunit